MTEVRVEMALFGYIFGSEAKMSDLLGRICFSNKPFHYVKRCFFHRYVLWSIGLLLGIGLPLALLGANLDNGRLAAAGLLLALQFLLWVVLLATVSFAFALPMLLVLAAALLAFYLGLYKINKRIADWAAKHDGNPSRFQKLSRRETN